jgi:hypothetical protein
MDLVFEINNNLSVDVCREIIGKFENDNRVTDGHTGGGFNPDMKKSKDLVVSRYKDWNNINEFLVDKLNENLGKYVEFIKDKFPPDMLTVDFSGIKPCGLQIQKSGHYGWHVDEMVEHHRVRVVTFIWYLNTIEEGGETGFHYRKVKPEAGKFVMFPATWDYPHCGFPATDKYIITGWLWKQT